MKDLIINVSPNNEELDSVKKWLFKEYTLNGEGFYNNWETIQNAFYKKELITLIKENKPIGVLVYTEIKPVVELEIISIKEEFRGIGAGSIFLKEVELYFKENENKVFNVSCISERAENFAIINEFIKSPPISNNSRNPQYYKPIIKNLIYSGKITENRIECFDCEPYQLNDTNPKYIWNIILNGYKLKSPIIHPASADWKIRLIIDNETIKEAKIKYLSKNPFEYYIRSFLIIDNIQTIIK